MLTMEKWEIVGETVKHFRDLFLYCRFLAGEGSLWLEGGVWAHNRQELSTIPKQVFPTCWQPRNMVQRSAADPRSPAFISSLCRRTFPSCLRRWSRDPWSQRYSAHCCKLSPPCITMLQPSKLRPGPRERSNYHQEPATPVGPEKE